MVRVGNQENPRCGKHSRSSGATGDEKATTAMRRTNTQTGAKFTVRGQPYIQVGSFLHEMECGHTIRILDLETDCPECGATFDLTATLRQIEHRILNRRCERCRKTHRGPVDVRKIEQRKAKREARERVRRRQTSALPIPGKPQTAAATAGAVLSEPDRQAPAPAAPSPVTSARAPAGIAPSTCGNAEDLEVYMRALGMV